MSYQSLIFKMLICQVHKFINSKTTNLLITLLLEAAHITIDFIFLSKWVNDLNYSEEENEWWWINKLFIFALALSPHPFYSSSSSDCITLFCLPLISNLFEIKISFVPSSNYLFQSMLFTSQTLALILRSSKSYFVHFYWEFYFG